MIGYLYMVDGETLVVHVTTYQRDLLDSLQRGATVYRPARQPRGTHHLIGRVKIKRPGEPEARVQDRVPDGLVAKGLLEVSATRAPGGFRLDYTIPQGIELVGTTGKSRVPRG